MRPKPKPTPTESHSSHKKRDGGARDGLGVYIADPAAFPPSRVIYHNTDFVAVHDLYPKSTVHTLLLPRSKAHTLLHPFDAFDDPQFLASVQQETLKLKSLVAKELQRRYGKHSQSDARREAVLNGEVELAEGEELPAGRRWEDEVLVGVHAHPSMNHLHVHVLSRDMFSERLRHRKHYNSFNTPFLVDVADFPLAADDARRLGKQRYLERDFLCWRCGRNFGNRFKALKEHLADEFEEWKKI